VLGVGHQRQGWVERKQVHLMERSSSSRRRVQHLLVVQAKQRLPALALV
jgi:hypothetical protein